MCSKPLEGVLGLVTDKREVIVPMGTLDSSQPVCTQVIKWLMDEREWQKKM